MPIAIVKKVDQKKPAGKQWRDGSAVYRLGELATRERQQQNGGVVKEAEPESPNSRVLVMHHRARCECRLDALRLAGKIDAPEFSAGMRYRAAWQFKAEGIKTMDSTIEHIGGGCAATALEQMNWAEITLREAHKDAGLSIGQLLVIQKVCGCDEAADRDVRTLQRGLDRLSRFWNLS